MSGASSDDESGAEHPPGDADDTNAIQQVGELVSMIMNNLPDDSELSLTGPSTLATFTGSAATEPDSGVHNSIHSLVSQVKKRSCSPSCPNEIGNFLSEARSLFSYYQRCVTLIELSSRPEFKDWDWLDAFMASMANHPRVSEKMKLRYFLHNKDNARTFRLIQKNLKLDLDSQFYMGKMNLLHIACDSGWANLASVLVLEERMDVNLPCPSPHMRPGNLTPLMLACGAGHKNVVEVLLKREDLIIDQRDKEGFTALFHACNHGTNRVGDQHGYFRRLWSWDLSEEQLNGMERIGRENSREILRLLITHGSDLNARDGSGANVLARASAVENFDDVVRFLVEAGARVTHNILNWSRVKNPACVDFVEQELRTPRSLLRQSRLCVWRLLRQAGSTEGFQSSLTVLSDNNLIPFVLVDYLNCR